MSNRFYSKLAIQNLRKNRRAYGPYILACLITVAMFYIICSLSRNPGLADTFGGETLGTVLQLGTYVVGFFSVIFLFYTNSFLVKRRKREFGLFNVLGMEKRHLARVIGLETLYTAVISIGLGLIFGFALDKAMFLLVTRVVGGEIALGFFIAPETVLTTVALFGAIFFFIYLNCLRQVYVARPVELLRSENMGEREPRAKWLMALVGAVCLGGGYYISITTTNVLQAMLLFFVAVILVIIGTYLLFTAGSVTLLKILRKNKRYYYKTRHFTSVSGMMYRMKQNAVGLANICILSTMVLVMISGTGCLMIGMEDALYARYPYDVEYIFGNDETDAHLRDAVLDSGVTVEKETRFYYMTFYALREGDQFTFTTEEAYDALSDIYGFFAVTLEDYNAATGENKTLADGEILLHTERTKYDMPDLNVLNRHYAVKEQVEDYVKYGDIASNIMGNYYIVVPDMDELRSLDEALFNERSFYDDRGYSGEYSYISLCHGYDLAGGEEAQLTARDAIRAFWARAQEDDSIRLTGTYNARAWERRGFIGLYGGLFFLGTFLGLLFTMAAILIIYYKQISEGNDDRRRFEIMQKVGMSRLEVKRTIHSQVLTVFFLPLVTAGVHVAFAFPIINRVLRLFNLVNISLYLWSVVGCFAVFAVIYAAVYALTARTYYRLVSM